jgi:protein-S-isoprenylcysteine O-methyltransferase Ste14
LLRWRVPLHFLAAAVVLVFAQPAPRLLLAGAAVVGLGVVVRGWAAGHLRRESPLTVSGPYAHVRHPLYLGTAFILAGFALAGGRLWLALLLAAYFVLLFVPTMRHEHRDRHARASELYESYATQVPAFWPRLRPARIEAAEPATPFQWSQYLYNQEWRGAVGCALAFVFLWLKMVWL